LTHTREIISALGNANLGVRLGETTPDMAKVLADGTPVELYDLAE
jgi:hypothetical protein